ncbi:MAG: hypothetical protein C5B52_17460 [Bacteroidetes bacterium]|nr:MAG: hypothetical protein C5B52_17460 [Bacteroidota bacterium]
MNAIANGKFIYVKYLQKAMSDLLQQMRPGESMALKNSFALHSHRIHSMLILISKPAVLRFMLLVKTQASFTPAPIEQPMKGTRQLNTCMMLPENILQIKSPIDSSRTRAVFYSVFMALNSLSW